MDDVFDSELSEANFDVRMELEEFFNSTGMPKTRFGRIVMNDPSFVSRVLKDRGAILRPNTILRCRMFIEGFYAGWVAK